MDSARKLTLNQTHELEREEKDFNFSHKKQKHEISKISKNVKSKYTGGIETIESGIDRVNRRIREISVEEIKNEDSE